MNQDEYILKTITGERDDLLEINDELKTELSQKDEMISLLEDGLKRVTYQDYPIPMKSIAEETLAKLNDLRKGQV